MNALGRHLLLELKDCRKEVLNDLDFLRGAMVAAADECGATVLGESFHPFEPQGVSGVVVIAESHLSIHTWPEYGYAAIDIFTCGSTVQPEKAAEVLIERLGAKSHSVVEIRRGLLVGVTV
ncbi:adenosylmethionine decarboxylase [Chloroflexota bacterium]